MQNHDEKITDLIRSVLPSTARRDARRTRQLIHRAARRRVKVATSRRTIDLDPRTVAVLRAWRKTQLEERLALGHRPDDNGIVFSALEGGPTHPDLFSQIFDRVVVKSSLPRIRLHDLRHTHASILLKKGAPVKVVSERLGHSSPAFTMSVYQHILPGTQADAALMFSDAVFGD